MKILYGIQGTGNGHVSRAREIIPYLKKYGELDLLISGTQAEVSLEDEVSYRHHGVGFIFGKEGGVDMLASFKEANFSDFFKDIRALPVKNYDLVISDFEPVTAWACKLARKPCTALSHQSSFLSRKTPQKKGFHYGSLILKNYAPAARHIAFHFQRYDDFIYTPVIRSEIRALQPANLGHYTVYLPAYSDEFILGQIKSFPEIKWQIFSKHSKKHYYKDNAEVIPIENSAFLKSLQDCEGLLTGGGFEGPAEALFLGKKVLSVPMTNQYEQQCNALALEEMGVPVIWKESDFPKQLTAWLRDGGAVEVNYPDETAEIVRWLCTGEKF